MFTTKEIKTTFCNIDVTIPEKTPVKFIPGTGGGYVLNDDALLISQGVWDHDVKHRYLYLDVKDVFIFKTRLGREALTEKSDKWHDVADQWIIDLNGQEFIYYTGRGLRKNGKPQAPSLDDVLYCLCNDAQASEMAFNEWCDEYGYNTDSIKDRDVYFECQEIANKLAKAGVDAAAERERLQDY